MAHQDLHYISFLCLTNVVNYFLSIVIVCIFLKSSCIITVKVMIVCIMYNCNIVIYFSLKVGDVLGKYPHLMEGFNDFLAHCENNRNIGKLVIYFILL